MRFPFKVFQSESAHGPVHSKVFCTSRRQLRVNGGNPPPRARSREFLFKKSTANLQSLLFYLKKSLMIDDDNCFITLNSIKLIQKSPISMKTMDQP